MVRGVGAAVSTRTGQKADESGHGCAAAFSVDPAGFACGFVPHRCVSKMGRCVRRAARRQPCRTHHPQRTTDHPPDRTPTMTDHPLLTQAVTDLVARYHQAAQARDVDAFMTLYDP